MPKQTTIKIPVEMHGIGLHSGLPVSLRFVPAPENTGIVFCRTDLEGVPCIPASAANVTMTMRATTLETKSAKVFTVEHVLAALYALKIDNCRIEMSAPEAPVADGSAIPFVAILETAGIVNLSSERREIIIQDTLRVEDGDRSIQIQPYDGFRITFTSINSHPELGIQNFDIEINHRNFLNEIAPARTIGFLWEVEKLQSLGLALGGNLENAVVYDETTNMNPLRFSDELVRHKILDVLGDLALVGASVRGHVIAVQSGHSLNVELARKVQAAGCLDNRAKELGTVLNATEIQAILPHRYPMLLVDVILEVEPMKRAVGIKNVTINEHFFLGHFPGQPVMPGVLLLEAMAQVGGVMILYVPEHRGRIAYFAGIDRVKFRRPVVPGDQLRMITEMIKYRGNIGKVWAQAFVGDELVAEGEFAFALMN